MTKPYELHYLLSLYKHKEYTTWNTPVLEQEIQCINHASMEIEVEPILLYNNNGFMHQTSIICVDLNNITKPNPN